MTTKATAAEHAEQINANSVYRIWSEGETWRVETNVDKLLVKRGLSLREAVALVRSLEYDMENPS